MPPDPRRRSMSLWEREPRREERQGVRAQQTVSQMVAESLVSKVEALMEGTDRTFLEAYEEVLETPAGRLLAALADGSDGHRKAAEWQEGLIAELQRWG